MVLLRSIKGSKGLSSLLSGVSQNRAPPKRTKPYRAHKQQVKSTKTSRLRPLQESRRPGLSARPMDKASSQSSATITPSTSSSHTLPLHEVSPSISGIAQPPLSRDDVRVYPPLAMSSGHLHPPSSPASSHSHSPPYPPLHLTSCSAPPGLSAAYSSAPPPLFLSPPAAQTDSRPSSRRASISLSDADEFGDDHDIGLCLDDDVDAAPADSHPPQHRIRFLSPSTIPLRDPPPSVLSTTVIPDYFGDHEKAPKIFASSPIPTPPKAPLFAAHLTSSCLVPSGSLSSVKTVSTHPDTPSSESLCTEDTDGDLDDGYDVLVGKFDFKI